MARKINWARGMPTQLNTRSSYKMILPSNENQVYPMQHILQKQTPSKKNLPPRQIPYNTVHRIPSNSIAIAKCQTE